MRIYMIWWACILYSYFQNDFDKSLAKNPERNLKIVLIRKEMLFRADDYLKERK